MMPREAQVIAITDCGSTTTKAILIEKVDGQFRQTARGDAPTTVEAPALDITQGIQAALEDLAELRGRRLVDTNGEIIRPARDGQGVDIYLSTSSAGGGLQMLVAGVVRKLSAQSAERAALGAGAIVTEVLTCEDERSLHEQVERMRELRPDMVLLAGGTDGGADVQVAELAELLAAADPKPRFGKGFKLPVLFAGNREIKEKVADTLKDRFEVFHVDNVRPTIEKESLEPARQRIHDLFLGHVMRQAPGFGRLLDWTDSPVMPTPLAVGEILQSEARKRNASVLCVDIGGATTDIFSVVQGSFNRTVSANLGMSYSATNVLFEAGVENVTRWLPFSLSNRDLTNMVMNKTIRPTTIPDSPQELLMEQALAREALRLSFAHHRSFASGLNRTMTKPILAKSNSGENVSKGMMNLSLLIGSGGVISHAPLPGQAALMLVDSFLPEGVTRLAKDTIFMMPHLGALKRVNSEAATSVFETDCLVDLGTCVAPVGRGKAGQPCVEYSLHIDGKTQINGVVEYGNLKRILLNKDQRATLTLRPKRGFDVGSGSGNRWSGEVSGGLVGLILDGRGRPICWPTSLEERLRVTCDWLAVLSALPPESRFA